MAYMKTNWGPSSIISAEVLNHAETQYDEFAASIFGHSHIDRYYTKAEANAKFFHSDHMGLASGADADLLDGSHAADIIGSALPTKAILAWSGSDASVPTGWAICNGQTVGGITTPDLRNRFIVGAGGIYAVGNIGGTATVTTAGGSVTATGHTLTISEIPSHCHDWSDNYGTGINTFITKMGAIYTTATTTRNLTTGNAGGGQPHSHPAKAVTLNSFSILPKYYALFFIQKVT